MGGWDSESAAVQSTSVKYTLLKIMVLVIVAVLNPKHISSIMVQIMRVESYSFIRFKLLLFPQRLLNSNCLLLNNILSSTTSKLTIANWK